MAWLKLIIWVTDSFTWRYWIVSPGVTGPYHLALLGSFTWRYWTVSPDVTGQFHLALLDRITWRYWTVSLVITEPTGQFHLALLKPITWCLIQDCNRTVQYATTKSLICDCFLKWSPSTWQISQWKARSADRYLANNWQIKQALPALVSVMSNYCITGCIIHHS